MMRSKLQFIINMIVFMSVDDKWHSILIHTLAQLISPFSSTERNDSMYDSSIDSLSLDANVPDQNGELLQFVVSSQNCAIVFDLKVVFTIRIYSSPSRASPLKMVILKAGIFVSVFLTAALAI